MERYDPFQAPDPETWQGLDESERIELVMEYHRESGIEVPDEMMHAGIHVVVENQLAMGIKSVEEALDRLLRQGLDRHDAVHAIGAVLSEHIFALLREKGDAPDNQRYYRRLAKLTAKRWQQGKW